MAEKNCLTFYKGLTKGTSYSKKKCWRIALKHKLKKESKDNKLEGLACYDSTFKPASMKLESPSHAKSKQGSPLLDKPLSRSNRTSKPKAKLVENDTGSQTQSRPKSKDILFSNNEEHFELEFMLPTIAKMHPYHEYVTKASYVDTIVLLSKKEDPQK
ncbi:hypothetical protein L0F63_007021 [Massospora cicadina]|nr:hypothetical protein L0F63_007021 [Massospora cicadina]